MDKILKKLESENQKTVSEKLNKIFLKHKSFEPIHISSCHKNRPLRNDKTPVSQYQKPWQKI